MDQEPTRTNLIDFLRSGATNKTAAKHFQSSETAIRRFRRRHQVEVPGQSSAYTKISGDEAEAQSEPSTRPILDDPDTMLRQRGLDPEQWEITHVTANEYQGPNSADAVKAGGEAKITYYQTKFNCVKRHPDVQLIAARSDGWKPPVKFHDLDRYDGGTMIVITGDQQAPFHDPVLHEKFLMWLEDNEPDRGVLLGDTIDFPDVSRHRLDPENTATVNECIQSGYNLLRDYVGSSPGTQWDLIEGNHDERLRNIILDKPSVRPLFGVKRADTPDDPGEDVLGVSHLLRLDELRINYISAGGKYDLTEVKLSDHFAVRHGWIVRQGSGISALETLKHLGYSVAVGHTHRQSMVYKTVHDIDRSVKTLVGVETGCMCRVSQAPGEDGRVWPNFTVAPDWQQGFATVTVYPDGFFKADLATFVNGVLLYRDRRY